MKPCWLIFLAVLATACAPAAKPPAPVPAKPASSEMPLAQLDSDFLYLAAQEAVYRQQDELAIRFLDALVDKDETAMGPRMQLIQLLLKQGLQERAIEHIEALLAMPDLVADDRREVRLLLAQALAGTGRKAQSLDILAQLLSEEPALFQARLLQVRLYMETGDIDSAHATIRQGLKLAKQPALYQIQAQLFLSQGKLNEAEASLAAMHKLAPDDETPVLMLSELALRRNDPARAEALLREFRDSYPQALRVSNALGRLLVQQKRLREAVTVYEDLINRTGGHIDILTALGLLYYQLENYERAVASFRQALAGQPDNASLLFYLAASLDGAGQRQEAGKLYAKIDPNSPGYIEAQMRLAGMDADRGRLQEASKRLDRIIRQHPEHGDAYAMLSSIRLQQKRYTQMLKETEPALALTPVPTRLLFNRAVAYEELNDFSGVEESLRRLLAMEPDNSEALNFLGYAFAERGIRLDEAEALIRRALKQRPEDGYYLDSLAWVHFKRGDFATALALQQRAVQGVKDDAVMHEHLGDILWKLGREQEARNMWQRALQLKHEQPQRLRQKIRQGL